MEKRHALGGAGVLLAACLVLLVWCRGGGSERPATEPEETPSSRGEQKAAPGLRGSAPNDALAAPGTAAAGSGERDAGSSVSSLNGAAPTGSSSAASGSGAAARINAAMNEDPRDLALFARIERELKRDPPPDVHAIVALRERGATRDELLAETRRRLPNDLGLRALVIRWIDEVAPAPGASPAPPAPSAAHSGSSPVQPIRKK